VSFKIKPIVASPAGDIPSAARALSGPERDSLIAIAKGLPDTWAVALEPPHGQVAIVPLACRRKFHRCWVAAPAFQKLFRDDGRS
jgi:hypothetical protein